MLLALKRGKDANKIYLMNLQAWGTDTMVFWQIMQKSSFPYHGYSKGRFHANWIE